jgi:galactokinase
MSPPVNVVRAPGRVNLIGDHTDYTGGLVFPMAIDLALTIRFEPTAGSVTLRSADDDGVVSFELPFAGDPSAVVPRWGTYVAAVAAQLDAPAGLDGSISSDIPAGAGLSSSAALECAVGRALGFLGGPLELGLLTQRAEHAATGVPTGIMDQLCIASARAGHATMIDCHTLDIDHVAIPDGVDIVVRLVSQRTLVGSAYSDRVAECTRAEADIGPLRLAGPEDVERVHDPTARRRARHVISENQRVLDFARALAAADFERAGALMFASHRSLRDDFDTSTPVMDEAVDRLRTTPGVFGARMTGGGFGGCIVALCAPGALDVTQETDAWIVRASSGVSGP